jgi:hypothetical protein
MFTVLLIKIPVLLYYPEDKGKKLPLKVGTHVPVWMVTISQEMDCFVHCLIAHVGTDQKEAVPENPIVDWLR